MTDVLAYKARLAEQLEMYNEMKQTMKELVEVKYANAGNCNNGHLLSEDERNLLSVAYKNVVGQRRTSFRIVGSLMGNSDEDYKRAICEEFKRKIEEELHGLCNEIIELLDLYLLLPEGAELTEYPQQETIVFFSKMKGDYLRYQVEISNSDDQREALSEKALAAYTYALNIAEQFLVPTHPIRLGLALNFSVYHYEIANSPSQACTLAKDAFDAAISNLDQAADANYRDSTLILQLLRDNLSLWTSETETEEQEEK